MRNKNYEILSFVERTLFWEGCISAKYLSDKFNIKSHQAEEYLSEYKNKSQQNIDTSISSENIYYPDDKNFKFLYPENTFDNILKVCVDENLPFFETLPVISPIFDKEILREIIRTINKRDRVLSIRYQSLNSEIPEERKIIPYSMSYVRGRYHVRAYCFKKSGFRDFVLSRIITITNNAPHKGEIVSDIDSIEMVSVIVKPHSKLSAMQKMCTEIEFGMQDQLRVLKVKKSMLIYLLDELRVGKNYYEPPFTVLELVNRNEINSIIKK